MGREETPMALGPTGPGMPALGTGFLLDPATVARLGYPGSPGIDVHDRPASTLSQARQPLDKHPRRAELDRLAIGPLPRAIGKVFELEGAAQCQHPMGELPMTALARGGEFPVELTPTGLDLALAFGHLPALAALLHLATRVVVFWIIGPTLPIEVPLQAAQCLRVRSYLGPEGLEQRLLLAHYGNRTGSQAESDNPGSQAMLGLAVGFAFADELRVEAVALPQFAAHQPHILDRTGQPMVHHRITPIQDCRQHQALPFHPIFTPADAADVDFALDRVQLVLALKAHALRLAQQQAVGRVIRPAGEFLDGQAIQMVSQPGPSERLRIGMQRIRRKSVLAPSLGKEPFPLRILAGQRPSALEGFGLAHQPRPNAGLSQTGIVHLTRGF